MVKYDKDTTLKELLEDEKAKEVLIKNNVPCLGCPLAKFEMEHLTLGQICKAYGISLKKLLKELNE